MKRKHSGGNGFLVLLAALLLAALTLVLSLVFVGPDPFANFFGVLTTPFRNAGAAVANWTQSTFSERYETDRLREEVERLRKELADMEEKARQGADASAENEHFRTLLGFQQKRRDLHFEDCVITARGLSNWESSFTINKGYQHGLAPDQCVVDPYGNLVGVVHEVGLNWATVLTLIDTDTDMGGLLSRTDAAAILEGDFTLMGQSRLKLSYLPDGVEVLLGDEVLTSGKGGVYPSGLVVGTVESIHDDPSGMTRYAIVIPKTDLNTLSQVFVIKSFDIVE